MKVVSVEEEWRMPAQRGGTRVCLWIGLECGHHDQKMYTVKKKNDPVKRPAKVRCSECEPAHRKCRHWEVQTGGIGGHCRKTAISGTEFCEQHT